MRTALLMVMLCLFAGCETVPPPPAQCRCQIDGKQYVIKRGKGGLVYGVPMK